MATDDDEFKIERAERRTSRLRMALSGSSGGGKTTSILRIAAGLADAMLKMGIINGTLDGKIGIIDTEQKSARLYAGHMLRDGTRMPPFDVIELKPPYTPERYIKALRHFELAGYPIIGIDQLSHAWAGEGGLLETLAQVTKNGNTFKAFAEITPEQNSFIEQLLASPAHLLVSMRSKTAWTTEQYMDNQGNQKTRPKRIGMAPIQRAGTEYEFTTLLNLDTDGNIATTLKDRTGLFPMDEPVGLLTEKHGHALATWLYTSLPAEDSGRGDGTPQERLDALVVTLTGKFAGCASLPDLAKEFETATGIVRKFEIELPARKAAADKLIAAKDHRKAVLTPAVPEKAVDPSIKLIGPDDVSQLEEMLRRAGIGPIEWQAQFAIVRLSQMPASQLDDAKDWIDAQAVVGQKGKVGQKWKI